MCNLSYLFSGMVGAGLTLCATSYWRIRDERKQKASLCASLRMELSTVLLECQKISESPEEYFDVLPTAKAGGFLSENLGFQPVARFLVHRPKHSGVKAGASYTISRGLDSQIP